MKSIHPAMVIVFIIIAVLMTTIVNHVIDPKCVYTDGIDESGMNYSSMECGEYVHYYTW